MSLERLLPVFDAVAAETVEFAGPLLNNEELLRLHIITANSISSRKLYVNQGRTYAVWPWIPAPELVEGRRNDESMSLDALRRDSPWAYAFAGV